jgi:hypothetical protein
MEENGRRDDMLLQAGFQLERARALLNDPGDITIDDIKEIVSLSVAREEAERKQREDALARDEERVALIKIGQERTSRLQKITRWAFAAIGATILFAGYFLWEERLQLATKEAASQTVDDSSTERGCCFCGANPHSAAQEQRRLAGLTE